MQLALLSVPWRPTIALFLLACSIIWILFSLVHFNNHSTSIFIVFTVLEFDFIGIESQNDAFVTFYFSLLHIKVRYCDKVFLQTRKFLQKFLCTMLSWTLYVQLKHISAVCLLLPAHFLSYSKGERLAKGGLKKCGPWYAIVNISKKSENNLCAVRSLILPTNG